MEHPCGACGGDGVCKHEFHSFEERFNIFSDFECPACGEIKMEPGNCSVCGGSGVQDDD